jgi:hypothetical protein
MVKEFFRHPAGCPWWRISRYDKSVDEIVDVRAPSRDKRVYAQMSFDTFRSDLQASFINTR